MLPGYNSCKPLVNKCDGQGAIAVWMHVDVLSLAGSGGSDCQYIACWWTRSTDQWWLLVV